MNLDAENTTEVEVFDLTTSVLQTEHAIRVKFVVDNSVVSFGLATIVKRKCDFVHPRG